MRQVGCLPARGPFRSRHSLPSSSFLDIKPPLCCRRSWRNIGLFYSDIPTRPMLGFLVSHGLFKLGISFPFIRSLVALGSFGGSLWPSSSAIVFVVDFPPLITESLLYVASCRLGRIQPSLTNDANCIIERYFFLGWASRQRQAAQYLPSFCLSALSCYFRVRSVRPVEQIRTCFASLDGHLIQNLADGRWTCRVLQRGEPKLVEILRLLTYSWGHAHGIVESTRHVIFVHIRILHISWLLGIRPASGGRFVEAHAGKHEWRSCDFVTWCWARGLANHNVTRLCSIFGSE